MFVYNEDSSPISVVMGFAHRLVSPATYECTLCDLTYDRFTMKGEWRRFLDRLDVPATFHFRNRFKADHPERAGDRFPMILYIDDAGQLVPLVTADRIEAATSLAELESAVVIALARARAPSDASSR